MVDQLSSIWTADPHTLAKHRILEAYLKAWMPIISQELQRHSTSGKRLLFVDGFAGPGSYVGGENGSPILAIESALHHSRQFPVPVSFLFIEWNKERYAHLHATIENYKKEIVMSSRIKSVQVKQGDCETILNRLLDNFEERNQEIEPAFLFLDQFGYSDVSMQLIQRIMSYAHCEVFSYLNWSRLNQFMTDKSKWDSITSAFGDSKWKQVLQLPAHRKATFIVGTYVEALKFRACVRYPWHFAMCDKSGKLIYWLFFCTNSLRGLEEMKRAMWKVDPTGGFRFSDKDDPSQLTLFQNCSDEILAQELASNLGGKILTLIQLKEYVLTRTPAYKFKKALRLLEVQGRLEVTNAPAKRRKGTFPDEHMRDIHIEFLPSKFA